MKLTYNPKTDIDRLNLLNSDEKVDLELGLLQSDYTYRENKGDVARIIAGYGLTDAYKAGGWNALSPEAQADINACGLSIRIGTTSSFGACSTKNTM